jgi:hypothetical protein
MAMTLDRQGRLVPSMGEQTAAAMESMLSSWLDVTSVPKGCVVATLPYILPANRDFLSVGVQGTR